MIVGLGGAAAVVMTSGRSSGRASSALAIVLRTVGAPLRWVICSPSQELPDPVGPDRSQAHVAPADRGDAPGRAPAVAVEHRQRPEVHGARAVLRVDHLAQRVEVGAAVGVDDALGPAGRARGVVDRDRVQLVLHRPRQRVVRAALEQVGVGRPRLVAARPLIGHGDDLAHRREPVRDRVERRPQLLVDHEQLRAGVVADVGDFLRGEAGVDRDEHRAGERHGEVRHQQLDGVHAQVRHAIAGLDAAGLQRPRRAGGLTGEVAVGQAARAVHDRRFLGEDLGRALEEAQRGQGRHRDRHLSAPARSGCASR